MKYYLDTEFIEGKQSKTILGIKYGETKPTIDLISIGIVSEDNREYYAISKEFNLKEAWNRFDKISSNTIPYTPDYKVYWIRDNILKPIWDELGFRGKSSKEEFINFNYKTFKSLINKYGKTNKEISKEIINFVLPSKEESISDFIEYKKRFANPEFYAYFADYDWVCFCWIFGKMIGLPNEFPRYCNDLKQIKEDKWKTIINSENGKLKYFNIIEHINEHKDYPKQEKDTQHNALQDAKWNKKLHEFLNSI